MKNYSNEQLNTLKEKMIQAGMTAPIQAVINLIIEEDLDIDQLKFYKDYQREEIEAEGREYLILSEQRAEEEFREKIKELIDSCGLEIFGVDLWEYMDESALEYLMADSLEWWICGASEEEILEEMEQLGANNVEELIEESIYRYGVKDYLSTYYEEEELAEMLLKQGDFDTDRLAEDLMNYYGREHELATYDGIEIDLGEFKNGPYYAYRIN